MIVEIMVANFACYIDFIMISSRYFISFYFNYDK